MNLLLTLLASPWHAGCINYCPISGQTEHKGTALVSNCRLAGPLLSGSTDNKENEKKGSQLALSEGGRAQGGDPGPVMTPSHV